MCRAREKFEEQPCSADHTIPNPQRNNFNDAITIAYWDSFECKPKPIRQLQDIQEKVTPEPMPEVKNRWNEESGEWDNQESARSCGDSVVGQCADFGMINI